MMNRNNTVGISTNEVTRVLIERGGTSQKGKELRFPCFFPKGHKNGDAHPSASWNEGKGVWCCHVCGTSGGIKEISKLLNITVNPATLQPSPKIVAKKGLQGQCNSPQLPTTPPGLTLAELADAKSIPLDFLKALGVGDITQHGQPNVRIPYYNTDGQIVAVRFRLSLDGDNRFRWRQGDKTLLYGLDRLQSIKAAGQVLLVEGETDCWTAWYHKLPALGLPGKTNWKPEWMPHLDGLDVYLWVETDADDIISRVAKDIPTLRVIYTPEGVKDLSEAHVKGYDTPSFLTELTAKAELASDILEHERTNKGEEYRKQAAEILEATDPLEPVEDAIKKAGYGGDVSPALICYLAATTRVLGFSKDQIPCHLLLSGPSSAGKSYTLGLVLSLFPPEAYHVIDAGSPRALIYDDADIEHRVLVFGEADSLPSGEDNPAASAVRNLCQDHSLHYIVTITDPHTGKRVTQSIYKPGPTVLFTTATRALGDQLNTRLFRVEVPHDREQVTAVMNSIAAKELNGADSPDAALLAYQGYLQTLAPWNVIVPYVEPLCQQISKLTSAPRIWRDMNRILALIKAVAILRHRQRDTNKEGRLIATMEDYATVRQLLNPIFEVTLTGVTDGLRAAVEGVAELATDGEDDITVSKLSIKLKANKGTVLRHVGIAIKNGWLKDTTLKRNKYDPYKLAIGEPLPGRVGLPSPEELQEVASALQPLSKREAIAEDSEGCRVAPLTETSILPPNNCPTCGGDKFWIRHDGEPICQTCHPQPNSSG